MICVPITRVRRAVQLCPDVKLMVDANGGLEPRNWTHARAVAKLLVAHNFTWLEEVHR